MLSIQLNKATLQKLWKDLAESVSGNEIDFTTSKLSRAIFLLSVPMVLEMVMESIFAIADIFFVAKLGENAIAMVGITESLLTIIYAIGSGLSMAVGAIISRRIGEKNTEGAAVAAVQAILVSIGVSAIISLVGIFFSTHILQLMGASNTMIAEGVIFTQIMLGGNFVIMLLFIINSIFRSAGDAALSMRVLIIANLINIVLDPCLIYGWGPFPELGIMGAAVATTTGRGVAVLIQIRMLFNKRSRIKIRRKHCTIDFGLIKQMIRLSLGGIAQSTISTSSWIGLMRIVAGYGAAAVAGYTIAIRILIFSLLPSWGISNAAATLVGQNLGAKNPQRAEKSVWFITWLNTIFLSIIGIILMLYSEYFISLFISTPEVILMGKNSLKIMSFGFLFFGAGMVMIQAFNGAGDTKTPTYLYLFCFWLLEIPLAYFLANSFGFAENGVYLSIVVAEAFLAIIGLFLFKHGRWKTVKV